MCIGLKLSVPQHLLCSCPVDRLWTTSLGAMASGLTPCLDIQARAEKRDRILQQLLESHSTKPEDLPEEDHMSPSYSFCPKRTWERRFRDFKMKVKALQEKQQAKDSIDSTEHTSRLAVRGSQSVPISSRLCLQS